MVKRWARPMAQMMAQMMAHMMAQMMALMMVLQTGHQKAPNLELVSMVAAVTVEVVRAEEARVGRKGPDLVLPLQSRTAGLPDAAWLSAHQ